VAGEIQEFAKGEAGNGRLKEERGCSRTALEDAQGMLVGHMINA
jgi:hypothetical protein